MIGQTAHIVVAFYKGGVAYARLNAIGVNSALSEIVNRAYFFTLVLKYAYKLLADDLALCLGFGNAGEL